MRRVRVAHAWDRISRLSYDALMRYRPWGALFRGIVASAAASLSACGGQVSEPTDSGLDANAADAAGTDADASVDAPPDVKPDLVDVSECLLVKGAFCSQLSEYDLACVRKKLGLPENGALSPSDFDRLLTDQKPCVTYTNAPDRLFCGQLCPGGPGRPGLVHLEGEPHDMRTVAGFFAECAVREAASVFGFEQVARELRAHDAPDHLVEWARRAAEEETRHASEMRAEALARGIEPRRVRDANPPTDSLYAFAKANLVEGCVAETYSALQLVWMAEHCAPEHRAIFERTAEDEVGHAGLAFEMHAWATAKLSEEQRAELRTELTVALRDMVRDASIAPPAVLSEVGMPPVEVANAIALHLAGFVLDHPSLG